MQLTLTRNHFDMYSTQGNLFVGGDWMCFTLELPVKDGLPGSAIPLGDYQVVLAPSPKFEASTDPWVQAWAKRIPHLLNVPNRTGILIHFGNEAKDTDGCVLVGLRKAQDFVGSSRDAFVSLATRLLSATDPIWIKVEGMPVIESATDENDLQLLGGS